MEKKTYCRIEKTSERTRILTMNLLAHFKNNEVELSEAITAMVNLVTSLLIEHYSEEAINDFFKNIKKYYLMNKHHDTA